MREDWGESMVHRVSGPHSCVGHEGVSVPVRGLIQQARLGEELGGSRGWEGMALHVQCFKGEWVPLLRGA